VALLVKQIIQVAVRTLVEHVFRSGDLEHVFLGASRAVEGIRAHQTIQKSRPDAYTPEVTVSHKIETDRSVLVVSGRIDGVYHDSDRVMIDEIKSTRNGPTAEEDPIHWGQAKCYAYLYGHTHQLETIDVQLTYYRFETGEVQELKKSFTMDVLEDFFNDLVRRYMDWAETVADWYGIRNDSLEPLGFPFRTYRPGQREMAVDVYRTVRDRDQLLARAATGIGKTMAVIYPSLKALGQGLTSKLFYLTARTTGRTVAEKALDELRLKGARIKSVTITAKDKICFDSENACTAEECEYANGYYDRMGGALKDIFRSDAFDREAIVSVSKTHRICPFEFSLELSLWADCIICDYNYAFDPRVYLRRFFLEENSDYVFLIDEAHNLVDRAREMFSAEIWKQPFLDVRRALKSELPDLFRKMGRINTHLAKRRKACEAAGKVLTEKDPPDALLPMLRGFLRAAEKWLALNIKAPFREELLDLFFTVNGFVRIFEQYDENYTTCTDKIEKDLKIKLFCVDPAKSLKNALTRCDAAVFFSATLTPMHYFKNLFGCDPDASERIIPSPFPKENLSVLVSHQISTRYRHRAASADTVAAALIRFVEQKTGNYLLFFPSYQYMKMIHTVFEERCPGVEIQIQAPVMSEDERDGFLKRFSRAHTDTLVGFVVMGGIFGEGIDLVGERLSGAAVVGVGLPGISTERDLIRDFFEHHHDAGFEYAYLFPGMIRVLQAAGRVIRTETDRGVIFLIGQRFVTPQYRSLLPAEWQPIKVRDDNTIGQALKEFWEEKFEVS
jgi:DNA excision repair protein ERCC-2